MTDFVAYLKTLEPDDWTKMATPKWTVHDVVAHMVGWEKRDAEVIPIFWQTKKREPWMNTRAEWDEFNRKEVEERKNRTPQQLIEEWEVWQAKVKQEIDGIGYENIRSHPDLFDWLIDGDDNKGGTYTLNEGGSHYEHHYEQIRRAVDFVFINDHGLLGSEYYWDNRERFHISEDELRAIGIDGRIQVHKDLIVPLQRADEAFQEKGMRLYIREGYRPHALYELAFKKRSEKFSEKETRRIMNMEDRPHASGKSVDIVPWDPEEKKEIPARRREDGVPAMFIDFYKERTDEEGKRYEALQKFMMDTMLANGFEIGKLREYFHFNYRDPIKAALKKEGFKHIYEWTDKPGTQYPSHKHQDKVVLYITAGGLSLRVDDTVLELKKGDRFDVPPGKEHTAKVGTEGCSYIVGEMLEGDS